MHSAVDELAPNQRSTWFTPDAPAGVKWTTAVASWFVVPSNHNWYRNWAVATLLLEHLQALDPQWPPAGFDVEREIKRIQQS
jgi:hypothetical protein